MKISSAYPHVVIMDRENILCGTDLKPVPATHPVQDAGFIPARYSHIVLWIRTNTHSWCLLLMSEIGEMIKKYRPIAG